MKRLERSIALKVMIVIPLITVASIARGPLRWVIFVGSLGLVASIFLRRPSADLEHLTVTINEYGMAGGQLRISGVLTNSGVLDVYRPELIFRLEEGRGAALANHSLWPTGQVKRLVSAGQSAPFSLTLPAPATPGQWRMLIKSPQYPFNLVMACDQSADAPPLRAV